MDTGLCKSMGNRLDGILICIQAWARNTLGNGIATTSEWNTPDGIKQNEEAEEKKQWKYK